MLLCKSLYLDTVPWFDSLLNHTISTNIVEAEVNIIVHKAVQALLASKYSVSLLLVSPALLPSLVVALVVHVGIVTAGDLQIVGPLF